MADVTMTKENERRAGLNSARNAHQAKNAEDGASSSSRAATPAKAPPPWIIIFLAVGLFSAMVWVAGIFINFIAVILNYVGALALWLWATLAGLKPPTFSSELKGIGGKVAKAAGPEGQAAVALASAAEKAPGASFAFVIFSSGVTPLMYLFALWRSNR